MNKNILNIALPAIITNITVPLLGFIDTGISGHLGETEYIGAISVGTMIFNLIYWNFGFLRMGTSGITAQAYGSEDFHLAGATLVRAVFLSLFISFTIIILQYPIQWIAFSLIAPSLEVQALARTYFYICVWNAPAILTTMAIHGWFLGMQDSTRPMYISISINIVNIIASATAVFICDMGFVGIAIGTLIASYIGLFFSVFFVLKRHKTILRHINWAKSLKLGNMSQFFNVNRDIFMRSVCLMLVTLFFTAQGARSGDLTLAANTIIMQLFILFSYFMDGFAFAGEAIAGKYIGASQPTELRKSIVALFKWGLAMALLFTAIYSIGGDDFLSLLSSDVQVIKASNDYFYWAISIPLCGFMAFTWDGIFIGATRTRAMLLSMATAMVCFFVIYFSLFPSMGNHALWLAFISYLVIRGIVLNIIYHHKPLL